MEAIQRFWPLVVLQAAVACSSGKTADGQSQPDAAGAVASGETSGRSASGADVSASSGRSEVPGDDGAPGAAGAMAIALPDASDTPDSSTSDAADEFSNATIDANADGRPSDSEEAGSSAVDGGDTPQPANANASAGVRSLLRYFKSIEGKKVVVGQLGWWHKTWCNNPDSSLWPFVVQQTGHTPGLYGGEFWTTDVSSEIPKLTQMWNSRALITIQWHAPNPAASGSTAWTPPAFTAAQWHDITTPGTALYAAWLAAIDTVAGYLKQLQDAGVTVIWRPFHESHGGWFWWGTTNRPAGALQALYQAMFDRFTTVHGLNNLVWNWSTGGTSLKDMYPGDRYVDIISMDAYGGPLPQNQYQAMLSFGKLVAWGEWGLDNSQTYVTPTWILANQPRVVYVMQWYGTCTSGMASASSYKPFFTDPNGVDSPVMLP